MDTTEFKVVMLGESRVGKTSIVNRFCKKKWNDKTNKTVNADCLEQIITIGDPRQQFKECPFKLSIWDTAGEEQYHAMNTIYYRDA